MDKATLKKAIDLARAASSYQGGELLEFLDQECAEDRVLRAQVEMLLGATPDTAGQADNQPMRNDGASRTLNDLATQVLRGVDDDLHRRAVDIVSRVEGKSAAELPSWLEHECDGNPELVSVVNDLLEAGGAPSKSSEGLDSVLSRLAVKSLAGTQQTKLGDYRILEEVGRGGMGVVYKAHQTSLDRIVAVKVLSARGLSDEGLRRFRLEAESVAVLDHPNIVPIYEIGEDGGVLFFSMKFIDGTSLDQIVESDEWSLKRRVQLMIVVARAVHNSHQNGILHRDLKPANILVDNEGVPFVTDFGIAKRLESSTSETQTGQILGTPSYLSPEQAEAGSAPLTTATDVYGLGAILYELLTGRKVVETSSLVEAITRVTKHDPKSPRALNSNVDRDLETICLQCLRRNPEERYDSANSVADDLERWLAGKPVAARPLRAHQRIWKWCQRRPAIAGLVALLIVLSLGSVALITWKWYEADHQRGIAIENLRRAEEESRRANLEAETSLEVSRFLRDLFEDGDPLAMAGRIFGRPGESSGKERTIDDILKTGTRQLANSLTDKPRVRARLLQTFGNAWLSLGNTGEASRLFAESEKVVRENFPDEYLLRISLVHCRARVVMAEGRAIDAVPLLRKALQEYEDAQIREDRLPLMRQLEIAMSEVEFDLGMAMLMQSSSLAADARLLFEQSLRRQSDLGETQGRHELWCLIGIAWSYLAEPGDGGTAEAIKYLRRALDVLAESGEKSALDEAANHFIRAKLLAGTGFHRPAEAAYQETLAVVSDMLGEKHFLTATIRRQLAHHYYWNMDEYAKSQAAWQAVLEIYQQQVPPAPEQIAEATMNLARCSRHLDELDQAIGLVKQSIDSRRTYIALSTSGYVECVNILRDLGKRLLSDPERADNGKQLLQEVSDLLESPYLEGDQEANRVEAIALSQLGRHLVNVDHELQKGREYLELAMAIARDLVQVNPSTENRRLEQRIRRWINQVDAARDPSTK